MKRISAPIAALLIGSATASGQAVAAGWTDRISIGGFASTNYSRTDSEIPFNGPENIGHDDKGSWGGTRVGLNVNAAINKRFRFASQLYSSKAEDFALHINWAFGDLTLTDELSLRTGKIKFPVGLVNEYVDVGYAMPWIKAPVAIYSELGAPNGPQITRESYTGASLLGNFSAGDWTLGADLFGGEIALEGSNVRELGGLSLTADWDDVALFQISTYRGVMRGIDDPAMSAMEGVKHSGLQYGVKADWNDIILYAERGDISMGDLDVMKATSWYTTIGYRIGKLLPHLTYQSYEQGIGSLQEDQQRIATLGLRWDFMPGIAFKAELSQIKTDKGVGLFLPTSTPAGSVNMISFGLDTVF